MSSCPNCGFPLGPHPFDPSFTEGKEEPTNNEQNLITLHQNDEFNFGKYKGRKVDDILHEDPSYIIWCSENVEWLCFDPDLERLAWDAKVEQDESRYDPWLDCD